MPFLAKLLASPLGQAFANYILAKLWGLVSDAVKDGLAKQRWQEHVKKTLADYEKVIEEARTKAADGLTEEEKAEIRKKKTELEESLFNEG